jgi:hypothetical protein
VGGVDDENRRPSRNGDKMIDRMSLPPPPKKPASATSNHKDVHDEDDLETTEEEDYVNEDHQKKTR